MLSCGDRGYGGLCCPLCGAKFHPEWSTEYSDPMDGDFMVHFPCCGKELEVHVVVEVSYRVERGDEASAKLPQA